MIDVTDIDLVEFAKAVYELSLPKGSGRLAYTGEPLSDDEARQLVSRSDGDARSALSMDYVNGRCCKMHVHREDGRLTIGDSWYNHTDAMYDKLLERFGLRRDGASQHGAACECGVCKSKRTLTKMTV